MGLFGAYAGLVRGKCRAFWVKCGLVGADVGLVGADV